MSESDRIQILLAEYATLRDEVMQRDSSLNQFLVAGALAIIAIAGVIAQFPAAKSAGLLLLLLDAALVFIGFKMVEFDVLRIADRLLDLERLINERAGERLLVWETNFGIAKQGYRYRGLHVLCGFASLLTLGLWKPTVRLWSEATTRPSSRAGSPISTKSSPAP